MEKKIFIFTIRLLCPPSKIWYHNFRNLRKFHVYDIKYEVYIIIIPTWNYITMETLFKTRHANKKIYMKNKNPQNCYLPNFPILVIFQWRKTMKTSLKWISNQISTSYNEVYLFNRGKEKEREKEKDREGGRERERERERERQTGERKSERKKDRREKEQEFLLYIQ